MPLLLQTRLRPPLTPLLLPVTWLPPMLPRLLLTPLPWRPMLLTPPPPRKRLPVAICPRLTMLPTLLKMLPTLLVRPRTLLKKPLLRPSSNIGWQLLPVQYLLQTNEPSVRRRLFRSQPFRLTH